MQTNWRTIVWLLYVRVTHPRVLSSIGDRPDAWHLPFPFTRFLSGRNESKKPLNRVFIAFNYDSSHNSATPSRVNHVERTTRVFPSFFLFFYKVASLSSSVHTVNYRAGIHLLVRNLYSTQIQHTASTFFYYLLFLWICLVILPLLMISVHVVLMDVISWLVYSACGWSFCRDIRFSLFLFCFNSFILFLHRVIRYNILNQILSEQLNLL